MRSLRRLSLAESGATAAHHHHHRRARSVCLSTLRARSLSLAVFRPLALLLFASLVPVGDGSDTPRRRTMGYRTWNFDIDRYLNPLVPSPPWRHLPYPVAYWFGYRKGKPREMGNLVPIFWAFIGVFGAILLIEGVSRHVPSFEHKGVPMIVGSFVRSVPVPCSQIYPTFL